MVREGPVGLHVERVRLDPRHALEHGGQRVPRHAVGRVDGHADLAPEARELRHVRGVVLEYLALRLLARLRDRRGIGQSAQLLDLGDARVLRDRLRALAAQLHAVVLARVVARRHAQAAVALERPDGEVRHGRLREPEADHVRARVTHALADRVGDLGRVRAHVLADDQALRLQEARERVADLLRERGVELGRHDAPDVVGLEDPHGPRR